MSIQKLLLCLSKLFDILPDESDYLQAFESRRINLNTYALNYLIADITVDEGFGLKIGNKYIVSMSALARVRSYIFYGVENQMSEMTAELEKRMNSTQNVLENQHFFYVE